MKSLMSLVLDILEESGIWCGISTIRDIKTVTERVANEGDSFLTITLPTYGKDFEKSLDQGYVDAQLFKSFSKRSRRGGFPAFLSGFLGLIFDSQEGRLLDDPSIDAIRAIRQITLMCGKVALPCTPKRIKAAIDGYIQCEKEVLDSDLRLGMDQRSDLVRMSLLLWGQVLQNVDEDVYYSRILPKHGPGTTADKLIGNNKFSQSEWTTRLEEYFPSGEYLFPSWRHYDADRVNLLEPGQERPVEVITVPKTLKTPRIIAREPTCMQYVQQGLLASITKHVEADKSVSCFVDFNCQEHNQILARQASIHAEHGGSLATLDLREASDRVSNLHVMLMTSRFPHLTKGIQACRSTKADVPGYGIHILAKFASMGSAVTFPIESMIFTTIIFIGIQRQLNRPLSKKDIASFKGQVRVYGDDIIVPVDFVTSVVAELESFGFKVNASKSFWTGKFRESCGKEYYDGEDVSITRVRRLVPSHRRDDPEKFISTVSLRNQLYMSGYWRTVKKLDNVIEKLIEFPMVLPTSPVLGRWSFLGFETQRIHPTLHSPLVKGWVERSVPPDSHLEGSDALLKVFLKQGREPFYDVKHLERSGRPDAVHLKRRWASAV